MGGTPTVVVVGGGLAGCSAALAVSDAFKAHAAASHGAHDLRLLIVDKVKLGGNSAKASSGINALTPETGDKLDTFVQDTIKSGGGLSNSELVNKLVAESQAAVDRLQSLGIDLAQVTQLGGHAVARSHTNPVGGNVGWSIMSKVITAVKGLPGTTLLEGHKLERLLLDPDGAVAGVELSQLPAQPTTSSAPRSEQPVRKTIPAQAVILATGGFGANPELIAKYNPAAARWATTNGPWAQGEGLTIAQAAGAQLIQLEQVQVHPTGFVDPANPEAHTKFLAPEKLRGVGGVLINSTGHRFVDELTTRDKVSAAVAQQPGSEAWLVLSETAAQQYGLSAIQFYCTKGLMHKVEGVGGLAALMAADAVVLQQELEAYNAAAAAGASGQDAHGKIVFPTTLDIEGVMYAGRITPVVHYTMGGVATDAQGRALKPDGTPVPGLYVAGEVAGGVHGANRLGGNSLLECAVYGHIAGTQAAKQVLAQVPASNAAEL